MGRLGWSLLVGLLIGLVLWLLSLDWLGWLNWYVSTFLYCFPTFCTKLRCRIHRRPTVLAKI